MTPEQLNSEVMGFSDTFSMRVSQACDEIELKYGRGSEKDASKIRAWRRAPKSPRLAALDIATGPNGEINLLDMVVMVTLKRQSIEEYDVPEILGGKGGEYLLPAYQRSYDEIWRWPIECSTIRSLRNFTI